MIFDLNTYLERQRLTVDGELHTLLPHAETRPSILHEAMRYSTLAGGKRLRPIFCMAACGACGQEEEVALTAGAALELFHTFTLIHDDLPAMDDDDLRRGKPTCHIQFGEAHAILAGDALQCLAFEKLAGCRTLPPRSPADLVAELARFGGSRGVTGGQVEDMLGEGQEPTEDRVMFIHTHKTGDLFEAAIRIGALTAGAPDEHLDTLTRYARRIGLAFQIADDILDEVATTDTLGKPSGSDREAGKMTYVALHGLEKSRQDALNLTDSACQLLPSLPGPIEPLTALATYVVSRIH